MGKMLSLFGSAGAWTGYLCNLISCSPAGTLNVALPSWIAKRPAPLPSIERTRLPELSSRSPQRHQAPTKEDTSSGQRDITNPRLLLDSCFV